MKEKYAPLPWWFYPVGFLLMVGAGVIGVTLGLWVSGLIFHITI